MTALVCLDTAKGVLHRYVRTAKKARVQLTHRLRFKPWPPSCERHYDAPYVIETFRTTPHLFVL